MRKNILLVAILAACSSTAFAQSFGAYGDVTNVQPHMSRGMQQTQQCDDVQVQGGGSSERSMSGSIVGGIAGALLGSTVGGGNGRTAAAAAGGIGGAIVGDRVQNNGSGGDQVRTVRQCRNISNEVVQQNGYDVSYTYSGKSFTTVSRSDPGDRIALNVSVTPRQ